MRWNWNVWSSGGGKYCIKTTSVIFHLHNHQQWNSGEMRQAWPESFSQFSKHRNCSGRVGRIITIRENSILKLKWTQTLKIKVAKWRYIWIAPIFPGWDRGTIQGQKIMYLLLAQQLYISVRLFFLWDFPRFRGLSKACMGWHDKRTVLPCKNWKSIN